MQYQATPPREFQVHGEIHSFLLPESFYSGTFQKQKHWCVSFAGSGVEGVEVRVFLLVSLGAKTALAPLYGSGVLRRRWPWWRGLRSLCLPPFWAPKCGEGVSWRDQISKGARQVVRGLVCPVGWGSFGELGAGVARLWGDLSSVG